LSRFFTQEDLKGRRYYPIVIYVELIHRFIDFIVPVIEYFDQSAISISLHIEAARKAEFFYSRSNLTREIRNIGGKKEKKISEEMFR